ncbi:MAG: redoxin domain-containing protein [Fimbriimonadaceae bacterium]|nr:redoxin domain-containing protein [Fimbriimonadaceae bacterium]
MMKIGSVMAALVVAAVVGFALSRQDSAKPGDKAPAFSAMGSDGKSHTLASLTKEGPAVLYFIKEDCPVNAEAVKYYNRMASAYKGKARLIGVINVDKVGYAGWAKRFKPTYPVLFDPSLKTIHGFKAKASPWAVEVGKDGKIAKVWPGYSANTLAQINARLAKAAGTTVAKVDLGGAPGGNTFG